MSDLYDSLEDESNEKNSSSDSLEECKTDAMDSAPGNDRSKSRSFYLKGNLTGGHPNSSESIQCDEAAYQKKNFLPEIENATKGWDGTPNLIVDFRILREQGLQINDDGSFTKSPRPLADELPFITREYRNLQFQKKKTYKLGKRTPRAKIHKKNVFSFMKSPVDGISMNKIISARQEKGSSEEILTSSGSLSSTRRGKLPIRNLAKDNLTDSMKEKLLRSNGNTPCETLQEMTGSLKNAKRAANLLEARRVARKDGISGHDPGAKPLRWKSNADRKDCQVDSREKCRILGSVKLQPDVGTDGFKPRLSYSERRQIKNGFDPLHLRMGGKKVLSDTNRSNFGDSVADRLSEVSSRILSCENLRDEDEEAFYRSLMEKDGRSQKKQVQRSSRSEGPCEFPKLKSSVGSGSSSNRQKESRRKDVKFKVISKSMFIDLPSESDDANRSIKKYHYCSADSSPKLSRFELALKAKTYGYMANARNIFKMKAQSEGRLSTSEGEDGSFKVCAENSDSVKKASNSSRQNQNFSSKSTLPEVPGKVREASARTSKSKKAGENTTRTREGAQRSFNLPRVAGAGGTETKIRAEILNPMSSCVNGPCGRKKAVVPWTFEK